MKTFRIGDRVRLKDGREGRVAAFRPFQGRLIGSGPREPRGELIAVELDHRQGIRYHHASSVEHVDEDPGRR